MKSIKEFATEYAQDKYMPVQTSQAVKAGANYVLEQIEEWLRTTDYTSYKPAEHDLWVLIEQLKK